MRLTLKKGSALVFNPQDMLDNVVLDDTPVEICKPDVLARVPDSNDELMALFNDHELVLNLLAREVLALRARIKGLEKSAGAPVPVPSLEDALLAITAPAKPPVDLGHVGPKDPMAPAFTPTDDDPGKIGPECFGGSDYMEEP